jgi:ClpP class serine protease
MINVTKESGDMHKKKHQGRNLGRTLWEIHEKIPDMVNQNVQDVLKKFQDTKNEEHEKAQKQINELREDFNKHQSETKNTI